jgi:hypothetical protein
MSQATASETSFAMGRYSKRKRTQVNYCMEEMEVDEIEEEEAVKPKVRRLLYSQASCTDSSSEATKSRSVQTTSKAEDLSIP